MGVAPHRFPEREWESSFWGWNHAPRDRVFYRRAACRTSVPEESHRGPLANRPRAPPPLPERVEPIRRGLIGLPDTSVCRRISTGNLLRDPRRVYRQAIDGSRMEEIRSGRGDPAGTRSRRTALAA